MAALAEREALRRVGALGSAAFFAVFLAGLLLAAVAAFFLAAVPDATSSWRRRCYKAESTNICIKKSVRTQKRESIKTDREVGENNAANNPLCEPPPWSRCPPRRRFLP